MLLCQWIIGSVYTITTWAGKQKYLPSEIVLSDLWENESLIMFVLNYVNSF